MITVPKSNDIHELNAAWEQLTEEYDLLWTNMQKANRDLLQKSIAEWQDFYYGNWDQWPDSSSWKKVLQSSIKLIDAEKAAGTKQIKPEDVPSYNAPVPIEQPIYVYGKVQKEPEYYDPDAYGLDYNTPGYNQLQYQDSPLPWGWIIGGVLGMGALYLATKKKKHA
jgi:hypothetical protein